MLNPISVIACCTGIIGCVIGVATFVSAQITKARQDGAMIEKLDYLVKGFDEQKQESKEKHAQVNGILDEHTKGITDLQARMKNVEKEVFSK